jgi:hypothetical protein
MAAAMTKRRPINEKPKWPIAKKYNI